jgi:hypothetical protein
MPSVTIDTGVLAVPPLSATADQAREYIELLVDWSRLLDEPWVAIYMSDRCDIGRAVAHKDSLLREVL